MDVSLGWLDAYAVRFGFLREAIVEARRQVLEQHDFYASCGMKFTDSPGVTCPID